MKNYSDKEVNRLLAAADDLLADIQLYETPEEEQRRKQKEEEIRKQEELQKQEEARQTEEFQVQKEDDSSTDIQPEPAEQTTADAEETIQPLEEMELPIDIHQIEALGEEEALRRLEEIQRQEAIRMQEEARRLKRMRWRELNGQQETMDEPLPVESQEEIQEQEEIPVPEQTEEDSRTRMGQLWEEYTRSREEAQEISGYQESEQEEPVSQQSEETQQQVPAYRESDEADQEAPAYQQSEKAGLWPEKRQEPESSSDFARIKQPGRMWVNTLFVVISMIYLELLTHFGIYQNMGTTVVYPVLFAAGLGCMVTVIASFLPERWNTMMVYAVLILGSLYCDLQLLYHAVSGTFLKLTGFPAGIRLLAQSGDALLQGFAEVVPFLAFMFLPVLLWTFVGREWIRFERSIWFKRLPVVCLGCILAVVNILCLDLHGYEAGSPYVCVYHFDSDTLFESAGEQLGMTAMTILELLELVTGKSS